MLGGLISFLGWPANRPLLTDWVGDGISIQPNATLAVTCTGLALLLTRFGRRRAVAVLGVVVFLIGATTLFQYASGLDLERLNTLLMFGRTWGRVGVISPGRMGPPGAVCWTLIGACLFASTYPSLRRYVPTIGLVTLGLATLSIAGYLFGADPLYTLPYSTIIAFQAAAFIVLAAAGLVAAIPERAPMRWFVDPGATGVVARRAVPFLFAVPFAVGWLRLQGESSGIYDAAFGVAIFVVVLIVLLFAVLWWSLSTIERHEAALRESERRLTLTLDSLTDGFMTFDRDWRFRFVNQEATRRLRRDRSELLGRNVWELSPEVVGSDSHRELHHAAAERESVAYEEFDPALERWYAHKAYPMPNDGVAVYFQDVTERKRIREQLDADVAAIRRLQALSTQLVRSGELLPLLERILATAADLSGTDKGNIQIYDPKCRRLRIVAHQGLGPRFLEQFAENGWEEGCSKAAARIERVIVEDLDAIVEGKGSVEQRVLLDDGIRAFQSTPLVSREGRLLGMLNNHFRVPTRPDERSLRLLDVLARMAADLIERDQAAQALAEAARRKDEFLATLAHELRNPLAPVTNAIELMRRAQGDPTVIEQARGTMERQVAQMVRLIDDLLDINRVTRNKLELDCRRVELASVVHHAVEAIRPQYESAHHTLELRLPADPIYVDADPMRLAQVFGNLLTNAGKYTKPGGRIVLHAEQDDGEVAIGVKDDGVGIPGDMLPKVFDMFTQVDRTLERSQGGLGIGLALVQRLVELHGGTVTAASAGLGQGSEFVVRLPVSSAEPEQQPFPRPRPELFAAPPRRILVVDDNLDSATTLAALLQHLGHDTRTAHDGIAALEEASRSRPDVILLDIGLPKRNGYDTCRAIRDEAWGKDVLMVALTGWGQLEDRRKSADAGFDRHMVKPVDHVALLELLTSLPRPTSAGRST
jgi:PAS domain S-box-containing protein